MQIHVGGRQQGKTTKMLEWMRAAPEGEVRVLVSLDRERSMQLLRENPDLHSWQFVSVGEMARGRPNRMMAQRDLVVLGIDDLDVFIASQFTYPVARVSLTGEYVEGDGEL